MKTAKLAFRLDVEKVEAEIGDALRACSATMADAAANWATFHFQTAISANWRTVEQIQSESALTTMLGALQALLLQKILNLQQFLAPATATTGTTLIGDHISVCQTWSPLQRRETSSSLSPLLSSSFQRSSA